MKYKSRNRNHCIFNDGKIYYYQDLNRLKTFEILQKNWCLEYVGYLVKMLINLFLPKCKYPHAHLYHHSPSNFCEFILFIYLFFIYFY